MTLTNIIADLKTFIAELTDPRIRVVEGPIERVLEREAIGRTDTGKEFIAVYETDITFNPQNSTEIDFTEYGIEVEIFVEAAPKDMEDYSVTRARGIFDTVAEGLAGAYATGFQILRVSGSREEIESPNICIYSLSLMIKAVEDERSCAQ